MDKIGYHIFFVYFAFDKRFRIKYTFILVAELRKIYHLDADEMSRDPIMQVKLVIEFHLSKKVERCCFFCMWHKLKKEGQTPLAKLPYIVVKDICNTQIPKRRGRFPFQYLDIESGSWGVAFS